MKVLTEVFAGAHVHSDTLLLEQRCIKTRRDALICTSTVELLQSVRNPFFGFRAGGEVDERDHVTSSVINLLCAYCATAQCSLTWRFIRSILHFMGLSRLLYSLVRAERPTCTPTQDDAAPLSSAERCAEEQDSADCMACVDAS